jgi:nucleotide-binding universal stress UspA family protein
MIKDILVNLPVGSQSDAAVNYAISAANAFDSHLTGLAVVYDPVVPGSVLDGLSADIVATFRAQNERAGESAVAKFDEAARRAGISAESQMQKVELSILEEAFARHARRFDLSVVGQIEPGKNAPEEILPETVLFGSGRPVLVVPYIQKSGLKLDRILVCWDGSRTAARALGDAMPFLHRSKSIDVVTMTSSDGPRDELSGGDIAHHLARHKLKVDFKRIVVKDIDVASTILSTAADLGSDIIVMGGYGHSRLREFVLGGATRGLLKAMTVPVLMSH